MANAFLDTVDKISLGKKIRLARIAAGLTQQELAVKITTELSQKELAAGLYITQSSLSDFENDISEPRWSLMFRIIKGLNADISFFIPKDMK